MNPILEPLVLEKKENVIVEVDNNLCECLLCNDTFDLHNSNDSLLAHLLLQHKLVIADIKDVVDLKRYVDYWKERFKSADPREFCFVMKADDGTGVMGEYLMLAHELPEDRDLREQLQRERLNLVLKQQQNERLDDSFSHSCLFCRQIFTGNRKVLFEHMNSEHHFSVGLADNIVFVAEFLKLLDTKLSTNVCLYCDKVFKDRNVLKEHMRKKLHKRVNPENREYDKFYLVNYLEAGKTWKEIMQQFDEHCQEEDWSDWCEPEVQAACFFCEHRCGQVAPLSRHMSSAHGFDFDQVRRGNDFYKQIKIVNYIRRQIHEGKCICCDASCGDKSALAKHMEDSQHFRLPPDPVWDQAQYYFPTYEDDTLLCLLDDRVAGEQAPVIPEECSVRDSILQDEELKRNLLL